MPMAVINGGGGGEVFFITVWKSKFNGDIKQTCPYFCEISKVVHARSTTIYNQEKHVAYNLTYSFCIIQPICPVFTIHVRTKFPLFFIVYY